MYSTIAFNNSVNILSQIYNITSNTNKLIKQT